MGGNLMNNVEVSNIRSGSEMLEVTCNIKGFDEVCDSEEEEKRKTNDCSNIGFNGEMVQIMLRYTAIRLMTKT